MSSDVAAYRAAEAMLWSSVGLAPAECQVRLACTGTTVRVQDVGEGEPVLFIHGGPNAGSTWAPLLGHVQGPRCLLVDRPGTGLSTAYPITAGNLSRIGAAFVGDVLDGLGLDRAHVVASSFGGHLALRSAPAAPSASAAWYRWPAQRCRRASGRLRSCGCSRRAGSSSACRGCSCSTGWASTCSSWRRRSGGRSPCCSLTALGLDMVRGDRVDLVLTYFFLAAVALAGQVLAGKGVRA